MTNASDTTLILGGTGKTGSRIAARLTTLGLPVRTAARDGGDVHFEWEDPSTHQQALDGASRLYLMAPIMHTTFAPQLSAFLDLAEARGVRHVTYLSMYGMEFANLPADFATFAAYGDFATGVLAMLALLTTRMRALFWFIVVAFNVVGTVDIIGDYYHGTQLGLADLAGQLGAGYAIPIIYVPLLMITHIVAFYLLMRPQPKVAAALARDVVAA
jgi:hypothetical protein